MFPYTAKDTESESDIQISVYNTKYTNNTQILSKTICFQNILKQIVNTRKIHILFYNMYKLHNAYFVIAVICVCLDFLYILHIFIYICIHILSYYYIIYFSQTSVGLRVLAVLLQD